MSIAAPNPSPAPRHQSLGEEIANSVSHGVGLLAAQWWPRPS
jgi:predicted anti-sigma-YlaC factor YlaD